MSSIFEQVKSAIAHRLPDVLADILPGGRVSGKEYVCASLQGGVGTSCATNLQSGKGCDFAAGESWGDVIALAAKVWNMRQSEAAHELARLYRIDTYTGQKPQPPRQPQQRQPDTFTPILPVPDIAPQPPRCHAQHGQASGQWRYADAQGNTLGYVVRFDTAQGKVILPLCFGRYGTGRPQWVWKALPEPRPLYNLPSLTAQPDKPVLLVEGEKTADAAQTLFPQCAVLTWSGGSHAVTKADWSPLYSREVTLWPDNDEPGFKAALELVALLQSTAASVRVVLPPESLPEKWDMADPAPEGFNPHDTVQTALTVEDFFRSVLSRMGGLATAIQTDTPPAANNPPDPEDLTLKEWPVFSWDACPGLLGDFVRLATRNSEADPAAVCITALVRFGAEVFGHAPDKGPHLYVGETIHPPRLFAVICGNSSKARKGTSRHPVTKLFGREHCQPVDLQSWGLPLPARESGGPLSTGEGLAYHVRDESDEDRERHKKQNPNEPIREKGDKRLVILDEEFASGLACTKREGNTLSMGIRCFWDSGDYAPLTKNNPVLVRGAHISILTHITMQELVVCLGDVQVVNGFGNRFLWICARRSKLVAMPLRMPSEELAPMQRELWRLVSLAQGRGIMAMNATALKLWESIYPELSQEHTGLAGSIINRAEAQTLRLALIYALLDGQGHIEEAHLQAALALWKYAQNSALYIFGNKTVDPVTQKILDLLASGEKTATELNKHFSGHVSKDRLQIVLQELEAQRRISLTRLNSGGRPRLLITMCGKSGISGESGERSSDTHGGQPCTYSA